MTTALLQPRLAKPRLRHRLTRLAEAATTPLLPADYLDLVAPLPSGTDLGARIVSVTPGHFYLALVGEDYHPTPTGKIKPNDPLPSEDPKVLTPYGTTGPT